MTSPRYSVPEINLLLALVPMRGTATTTDFKEKYRFDKVDSDVKKALAKAGFLNVDDSVRPFIYELTDAGWAAARELIASSMPKGVTSRTARILWVLVNDFEAHMKLKGTELPDIYAEPTPDPTFEESADPVRSIERAYRELVDSPSTWLPLHELRQQLNRFPRSNLDNALIDLFDKREIQLMPEENQKTLRPEDREAALWLGGGYKHFILIEAP